VEQFIYNLIGQPVGFSLGMFVFGMDGRPIGQILGTRVYTLAGRYVGELHEEMVVNKLRRGQSGVDHAGDPGPIRPPSRPPDRPPATHNFVDVFDYLTRDT
jgi:hypothetical protein